MALVAASINVNFNANYTGCHRVCWRIQGDPSYNCTTQVTCAGNGQLCSAVIPITVDDASCATVIYEGYVQACCEDVASTDGRVAFTVNFVPNPDCVGYTVTCIGPVGILGLTLTNAGSGYLPLGGTVAVSFSGGGGGSADAVISDGGIATGIFATMPTVFAAGYTDGTYFNVPAVTLTGVGAGAFFNVQVVGNQIFTCEVVPGSNGSGYLVGDTFNFNPVNLGGGAGGEIMQIVTTISGTIQGFTNIIPGAYSAIPTATIPPPGAGTQALATVILENCPAISLTNCGPVSPVGVGGVPLGESYVACSPTPYSLPAEYTSTQDSCCNVCTSVTVDKALSYLNPPATFFYQDCVTKQIIGVPITAGATVGPICAVNNSWFVVESDPLNGTTNVTVGTTCS